jgi:AraC-like DNA-binding protein
MASRGKPPRPTPRPDRRFYAATKAFGRFGMRTFAPEIMPAPHSHGHIEFNWLTSGEMDYVFDGGEATVAAGTLVAFWAGLPHQTVALRGAENSRQHNIYLPMDAFLEIPRLGKITETLMGGGVISLPSECAGLETIERWYGDYRSGNAQRSDIIRAEIAMMLRRAAITGWQTLIPPWINHPMHRSRTTLPVNYVVQMVRYIVENIATPLDADKVAGVVGLHPNYATNLFTAVMQIPPQKFITRLRLIRARSLLYDSDLSIANIAFQAGFGSQTQFYDHFRKAYGVTPSRLRSGVID